MSTAHAEACDVLRKLAAHKLRQFVHGSIGVMFFALMFVPLGLFGAMPGWEAATAFGVLMALAAWAWLRGKGYIGVNLSVEFDQLIAEPERLIAYSSKNLGEAGDGTPHTTSITGEKHWRVRLFLSDERTISLGVLASEKRSLIKAIRVVCPEAKCRR